MSSGLAPPTRIVRPPFGGHDISKLLWKRLHLPRTVVHSGLRVAKRAMCSGQIRRRAAIARKGLLHSQAIGRIEEAEGYLSFGPQDLPGTASAVARCIDLFEERRREGSLDRYQFNPNKEFLLAVASGNDFSREPDLVRFMVSRQIVDTVSAYLGTVPLLAGPVLWWSPPNESVTASQRFHVDTEDWRQVKVILNVFDINEKHGPFTLLPAGRSDRLRRDLAHRRGRIDDEVLFGIAGRNEVVALTGPPGSGAFVDTSRCLHFGSRGNQLDRVVLIIQFLRFDSPTQSTFDLQLPPDILGSELDEVQRLVLGIE